jgi:nucleoside-diphosphate-sugar epimerase
VRAGGTISEKIFISGGAGFLGINLIRKLLCSSYQNITSLDIAPFHYPEERRIRAILGDIRHSETVENAVAGSTMVIHCAAALPLYRKRDIISTEIEGTRNLLKASLRNHVARFIHISSTAVYGVPRHHPICETDPLVGVGAYGKAKIEAERLCEEYRKKGVCVTILRPKTFVGPERLGVFAMLYDWAADGRDFPLIGGGRNRYQLLDVEDLCRAVLLCMEEPDDRVNDTFNIGAGEFGTLGSDFQAVLEYAGYGKRIRSIPAWPAVPLLRVMKALHLSPLYKWVYETAGRDSYVSIEKAQRRLGYIPQFSNRDALIRNFQWYLENRGKAHPVGGTSHRAAWSQGLLGLVKKLY